MTPKCPIGVVPEDKGFSQGVRPVSYWPSKSHIGLPAAWLGTFFIAIRIIGWVKATSYRRIYTFS
jgi:hypothetical protein